MLENSTLLKARKTVKLRALPMPIPIVWAVDAYERLGWERRVRAQPIECGLMGDGRVFGGWAYHQQRYLE